MRVLIIGGCGYIGSRLAMHLKEIGMDIESLDLEWFGNTNKDNVKVDLKHFIYDHTFRYIMSSEYKYDAIVLLAGHSSVPMCENDRKSSFYNNVLNFVNLIDELETVPNKFKFIYASSSSIYGNTQDIAASEDWERYDPKTHYDLQKQEIDYYAKLSNLEYYGLRFGTVNGWSPNLRTDIMINKMYECAIQDKKIQVFNKHVFRPILGIKDLCRAIETILNGGDHRGIYNLASFNASVEEIANAIKNTLKEDVEIIDKGIAQTYNFSINTKKFKETYDFEFQESVNSIVRSLEEGWSDCNKNIRKETAYEL